MRIALVLALAACGSDQRGENPDAPKSSADAAVDANPNAPTCMITAPTAATSTGFDIDVVLTASATDPQDGALTGASIVWKTDLQGTPLGTGGSLNARLPVGTNLVTCSATDSTSLSATSAPVTIVSKSPYAKINHPGDGEMRSVSQAVPFVGIGRDVEDGSLTGASLVWTSNLDGQLNTGETFNRTLTAGVHTITLTATDSNSNTDSVSITLTMQ